MTIKLKAKSKAKPDQKTAKGDSPSDKDKDASTDVQDAKKDNEGLLNAILWAAAVAIIIRSLLFEPFSIPSGSMFPTLKVGDYLFVSKYSYGYSKYSFPLGLIDFEGRIFEDAPERGDIAVFRRPYQENIDYIKRIIGLPGDEIQMIDGQLHINGELIARDFKGVETLTDGDQRQTYQKYAQTLPDTDVTHYIYELNDDEPLDFTMVFKVPNGYFFAMGDNRDESLDSRAIASVGFVPVENLVGRAAFFFFSAEPAGDKCLKSGSFSGVKSFVCKLVNLPMAIRYSRILRPVHRDIES